MLSALTTVCIYGMCGLLGWFFALPIYFPAIRERAIEFPVFRRVLMATLFIITFAIIFSGVAYVNATDNTPFQIHSDNPENNPARYLRRELWFDLMLLPVLVPDATCFTGSEISCQQSTELLQELPPQNLRNIYLNMLFSALIPALSCIALVWFVTRSTPEEDTE